MVTVIDSGIVNIRNIARALEYVGATVCVSRDVSDVERAKRIVLPGVGAFAPGMKELRDRRLDQAIVSVAHLGIPVLGICLGMQMLFEKSYEKGCHSGLGIIPGTVIPIPRSGPSAETSRKVPHVGWSELERAPDRGSWDGTILSGTTPGEYVYFVHSFMASTEETTWPLAQCTYQGLPILAAVEYENITAVQFHPERSGSVGLGMLERFLKK